jgi:hypothetical protein
MSARIFAVCGLLLIATACAAPEKRLLASWYIFAEGERRTLYLGLLNAGERQIHVESIVLNNAVGAAALPTIRPVGLAAMLLPGDLSFIELGAPDQDAWKCRLPVALSLIQADGQPMKADITNPMPTSMSDVWRKACTGTFKLGASVDARRTP